MLYLLFAYEAGVDLITGEEVELSETEAAPENTAGPSKSGGVKRKCKNCGEPGHRSDTCPAEKSEAPAAKPTRDAGITCRVCKDTEHFTIDCPDFADKVKTMHEEDGLDTLRISATLKVPFQKVRDALET